MRSEIARRISQRQNSEIIVADKKLVANKSDRLMVSEEKTSHLSLTSALRPVLLKLTWTTSGLMFALFMIWFIFGAPSECREISSVVEDMNKNTLVDMRWTLKQKIECAFAPPQQRQVWLEAAEQMRILSMQIDGLKR